MSSLSLEALRWHAFRFLGLLAWTLAASVARSADGNRTVCFDMRIRMASDIYDCAQSFDNGVRRFCEPDTDVEAVGQHVELWDKDPGGAANDDYLGTGIVQGGGWTCVTFAWVGNGEFDPDVFLKLPLVVERTNGAGPELRAIKDDRTDYPSWSWRGVDDNDDTFVANNCTSSCSIFPLGFHRPTSSTISAEALALMASDFGQRALEVFAGGFGTTQIVMEVPRSDGCTTGCTVSDNEIGVPSSRAKDGDLITHELGHVLHRRKFNLGSNWIGGGCSGTWNWNTTETESCATVEGWATYVGAVSWWDPGQSNNNAEYSGNDMEEGDPLASTCSSNTLRPGQLAKAFWDLDDFNNEAAEAPATVADSANISTSSMAITWGLFPDGTGNGQRREPNPTGRNIWDYFWTQWGVGTSFINHNCLQDQDDTGY